METGRGGEPLTLLSPNTTQVAEAQAPLLGELDELLNKPSRLPQRAVIAEPYAL